MVGRDGFGVGMKVGDLVKWNYPALTTEFHPSIGIIVSEYSDNSIQSYWNVKWACAERQNIRPINTEYLEVISESR